MPGLKSISDFLEGRLLDILFRQATNPYVSPVYVALFLAYPGETGASNEVTTSEWSNYARVSTVTTSGGTVWDAAGAESSGGGKFTANSGTISFGTATIPGSNPFLKGVGIFDAATTGNFFFGGPLVTTDPVPFFGLASNDTFYSKAHGLANGTKVIVVNSGGGLPTGVSEGTEYFIIATATDTFQLSTTSGGSAIDITANGDGMIATSGFKTVNNGDPVSFAAAALKIALR